MNRVEIEEEIKGFFKVMLGCVVLFGGIAGIILLISWYIKFIKLIM